MYMRINDPHTTVFSARFNDPGRKYCVIWEVRQASHNAVVSTVSSVRFDEPRKTRYCLLCFLRVPGIRPSKFQTSTVLPVRFDEPGRTQQHLLCSF
jgi:hypothetical protein